MGDVIAIRKDEYQTQGVRPATKDDTLTETFSSQINYNEIMKLLNGTLQHTEPTPSSVELNLARNEMGIPYLQHSSSKESGDDMDSGYQKLIDRLDQDMRDHKQEIRNRDSALLKDAQERENRYKQEMIEQNSRLREEAKEREERILNAINDLKSDFKDVKDESKTTRNTVIGLTVSVIIGVAAMVLAMVLAK